MKKIAIVGVEGSGKTVLMAAMGDKYKSPDANGVFLKPVNRETFAYCEKLMGQMQDGKWPIATGKAITDNLRWTLTKKIADGDDDKIAELSFLDFGGEIYRLAFGGGVHEEPDEDTKNAIAQLRSHVEEAEVLIVLVNLSDIINGKRNEERTIEMNWLSQAILSFAYDEANKSSVALVFTQADSYAETIADCGGLRGVLTRYMPTVDTSYGKRLALFSVAAVNKTIPAPDGSGFNVPSPDFKPQGLENLVSWVVDYVVEVRRRKEQRVSQAVEAEESRRKRWKISVGLIGLLGILGLGAWIGYNVNAEFKNRVDDQLMGIGWMHKETLEPPEHRPVVPSVKPVEEPPKPPVEPSKQPKPEPKWVAGVNNPNNPHLVAGESRNTWVATRPGYVWVKGTDRDEWKSGLRYAHAVSGYEEGVWTADPGYTLANLRDPNSAMWTVGQHHSQNYNLIAAPSEGSWVATRPGYVWVSGTNRDEWRQGLRHGHALSGNVEGTWKTDPGYVLSDSSDPDSAKWTGGQRNPDVPHIYSNGEKEGSWYADAGYKWRKMGDAFAGVDWEPGKIVNGRKTGNREGEWLKKCTRCKGAGRVTKRTKCSSCDGSGKIKTKKDCLKCDGSGKVRTTSRVKCPNCGRDEAKNLLGSLLLSKSVVGKVACPKMGESNFAMNNLGTFNGQFLGMKHVFLKGSCLTCGGQGRFISPMGVQNCISCGGYGYIWEFCNTCNGEGIIPCGTCGGSGEVRRTEESMCNNCDGDGWVYKSSQCSYCKGEGETSSTSSCKTCSGDGWVVE